MPQKDKSLGLILEILPGIFGFMGFGWIYANQVAAGILILIGFWVWIAIAVVISMLTGGIFLCCAFPVQVGAIAISAIMLNKYMSNRPQIFK